MRLFNRLSDAPIDERVNRLRTLCQLVASDLPADTYAEVNRILEVADERLALNPDIAVVALIGATGSGKSSLFNSLLQSDIAQVGLRRPTTTSPLAAIPSGSEATELLDWLEIQNRVVIPRDHVLPNNVTIVDLPDIDSVDRNNRLAVDQLAERVDVLVWVVDPQKYADDVLHSQFIRPLAHHSKVTIVVLSQVDRLQMAERELVMNDLRRLVEEDGLHDPRLVATSAVTGEGLDILRDEISEVARIQLREAERLKADVGVALERIRQSLTPAGDSISLPRLSQKAIMAQLVAAASDAAGVPAIRAAVRSAYIHRGAKAVGWLPTRKLRMLKSDPLRRLHLGQTSSESVHSYEASPASITSLNSAVRQVSESAGAGRPRAWKKALREVSKEALRQVPDRLNRAVSRTDLGVGVKKSAWWRLSNTLQWLGWLAAIVGGLWLGGLYVAREFFLITVDPPMFRALPIPTWLVLAGLAWTILVSIVSYALVRLRGRRIAQRATASLEESISEVVFQRLWSPLKAEDTRQRQIVEMLDNARQRS
ncbi:MAG: 50S ribosome-binding GTPase [Actinomycetaceae bacterium]|nr:50S ribosome-binding GTPase [Actinomycetaceae bacterium]